MINFLSNDGFAVVDIITSINYTVFRFNSEQEWRTCKPPLQSYVLDGSPNKSQILAALPSGFTYNGTVDIPQNPVTQPSLSPEEIRSILSSQLNLSEEEIDNFIRSEAENL